MELATTTPEQRAEIYADVRSLIVPGFLAHHVQVDEARFCFRSLDREDWEVLQYRGHGQTDRQWKAWVVASAIWMVNGRVLLGDEDSLWNLAETFSQAPKTVIDALYSVVNSLMRRVGEAADRIEGFLYEQESRRLWRTYGTSISEQRGRKTQRFNNAVISLWVYYNRMEDRRESEEHDWHLAKFMMSPHAPKGVKKITAKDNQREADMERRRQRVMDRTFYEAKGLLTKQADQQQKKSFRHRDDIRMAETTEELQEVMRRWVAGIKDDHDHVVDNVKAKIKHDVEERKRTAARRRAALDQALAEEGFTRSQPLPLSGDAGKKFLERMRSRLPGASVVIDDNTHNRAYSKYIENNPEVGDLYVNEEGQIVSSRPVTEDLVEVLRKPAEGERLSLQQQIERRRPTAQFVDDGEED